MTEDWGDDVERAAIDARYRPRDTVSSEQFERIVSLREGARLFARHLLKLCPPSWDREESLRNIHTAMLHAEAAIRLNE